MLFPKYICELVLANALANAKFSSSVRDKMLAKGKEIINLDYESSFNGNMI